MRRRSSTEYSRSHRTAHTLIELTVAMSAATLLMAGLASALFVSARGFKGQTDVRERSLAAEVQADMLSDIQQATAFTTKTPTSVTFTVPDRDGDSLEETISYDWNSGNGRLNYIYNGSAPETLVADVSAFNLSYLTRTLSGTTPTSAPLDPNTWGERWALSTSIFGYDTQFASLRSNRRTHIGTRATLNENGTVTSITAYFTVIIFTSSDIRYAIYDVDQNDNPRYLMVESPKMDISASGWHTINVPPTYLSAGEYFLCLSHKESTALYHYNDAGGGQTRILGGNPLQSANSHFKAEWLGNDTVYEPRRVAIYATYEPE